MEGLRPRGPSAGGQAGAGGQRGPRLNSPGYLQLDRRLAGTGGGGGGGSWKAASQEKPMSSLQAGQCSGFYV